MVREWFWAGDKKKGGKPVWNKYAAAVAESLETAYNNGKRKKVKIDDERYVDMADRDNMVQRRYDDKNKQRDVMRGDDNDSEEDEEEEDKEDSHTTSPPAKKQKTLETNSGNNNNNNNNNNSTVKEQDINCMTVAQLKNELRQKGLAVSGAKSELITRLKAGHNNNNNNKNPYTVSYTSSAVPLSGIIYTSINVLGGECHGWQVDGWYCGSYDPKDKSKDVHYGGFGMACLQCNMGWLNIGWFCGCCWRTKEDYEDQMKTRSKFSLAEMPEHIVQEVQRREKSNK